LDFDGNISHDTYQQQQQQDRNTGGRTSSNVFSVRENASCTSEKKRQKIATRNLKNTKKIG